MYDESRQRKCCPTCECVSLKKQRKHGQFVCKKCGALFLTPVLRDYKIKGGIPKSLKIIMEKKKQEAPEGEKS
jgi:ribosomal protein L37AE/L43A